MGVVFCAEHLPDGSFVALKVLKPALAADAVYRQRFAREARVAGEVQHPHLVRILESGEDGGHHYLAVAHVQGGSLERRIEQDGRLPVDEVIRLVAEIAAGLDALHAAHIVHRDVKPANVMLDEHGSALLTDYGLAKGRAYTVLTRPGEVMGTLDYIAPELISGEEARAESDIYALGCLVYECLTGAAPFAKRTIFEVAVAHLEAEPVRSLFVEGRSAPATRLGCPAGTREETGGTPPHGDRVRAPAPGGGRPGLWREITAAH